MQYLALNNLHKAGPSISYFFGSGTTIITGALGTILIDPCLERDWNWSERLLEFDARYNPLGHHGRLSVTFISQQFILS